MRRLDQILAEMASAPENEFERLLSEVYGPATGDGGEFVADVQGEEPEHPPSARHGEGTTRSQAVNEKDGTPERPAKFQGGVVNATTKRGRSCRSDATIRIVWNNPAMPTMDMRQTAAFPTRKAPARAAVSLMLVVDNEAHSNLANSP